MKLARLLEALPAHELRGTGDIDIRSIQLDSRRVSGGDMFVCLEGLARNGHDFAAPALSQGAAALLVTRPLPEFADTPQVVVADTREAAARIAAAFFSYPARELEVVGVTGTNGKTTVTHLVEAIARVGGRRAEVLGTLGSGAGGTYRPTGFTTPEAPDLQRLLRDAADRGVEWMAMEVSSHALAQKRVYATDFSAVVFTNLTRDHLDYHGSMESYLEAKALLFSPEGRGSEREAVAILNRDDPAGDALLRRATGRTVTYGEAKSAEYRARDIRTEPGETRYTLVSPAGTAEVRLALSGRINVWNALAAQAAALELGIRLEDAARGAETVRQVPGRMEVVIDRPFAVLVDYAHNPDALERALRAAREFTQGRLTVVFGCGGDRDRGKRPEMGRVAAKLADRVVMTSDNPRGEDPEAILDAILAGVPAGSTEVLREADRAAAIGYAVKEARPGDVVLVAGKGHETTQEVAGRKIPFDDRQKVREALSGIGIDVDDGDDSV
jgi:UDP-N-acetylmuramoyl-L-alanyl-D-glutamate--2,6-diaminopimelate ligase